MQAVLATPLGLGVESIPVLIKSSLLPFEYSSHSSQAFLLAFLFHTATRPGFGLPIPSIQQQLDSASYLSLLGNEMLTGPVQERVLLLVLPAHGAYSAFN